MYKKRLNQRETCEWFQAVMIVEGESSNGGKFKFGVYQDLKEGVD